MKLTDYQLEELNTPDDADPDEVITPIDIIPKRFKEYPAMIERCEWMRRFTRNLGIKTKEKMDLIEDQFIQDIENEQIREWKGTKLETRMPLMKKKYNSKDKRDRELRLRLAKHVEYQRLKIKYETWNEHKAAWLEHINRLRRDLRRLEIDYSSIGGGTDL